MRRLGSSFGLAAGPPPLGWGLLAVAGVVAVGTGLVYPLADVAPVVSLGVVYLPGVLLISTLWGWRLGLLTAAVSALAFNYFHIPPTGRLEVAADRDGVALVVFAIVAVASSALAELARARAAEAERRREQADRLLAELRAAETERERLQVEAIEAGALRRSDELKTALLRSVSHDLRTPLTSIIAAGAALDSPSASAAERHELSQAVITEGQRLSRLVENLLDVSRLESGNAAPRREPVDLAGVLEAARSAVGAGPEEVRLALDPELPALEADAAQLERAFANLLENGVRHGEGRPVLVRSRSIGGRLVVRVVDQGPGIPEPERARLFEPFYRREDGSGGGAGLGLAISRGFVEANGGELAVESVPGQGSTFVVSFPLGEGR
ncbi:MAG: two-component system, OmpR family, sensor histidine kinase KdpD [Solirubrobacterales bacterium]|jgi:two-component system sensor histidine kinase KdpD|nr:two-component system, OmpR family, sensor histidine kinase KdpD [Solirubrobacterales bacterium]